MSDHDLHEDEGEVNEDGPSVGLLNDGSNPPARVRITRSVFARASVFMAFHFSIAFCEMVLVAPLLALFERSICASYYAQHDPSLVGPGGWVGESHCKLAAIQKDLATVRGWKSFFDTLPGTR